MTSTYANSEIIWYEKFFAQMYLQTYMIFTAIWQNDLTIWRKIVYLIWCECDSTITCLCSKRVEEK